MSCDSCGEDIDEEEAGSASIQFTVRGEQRELDLCDECLGGSFLQEARPVTNRRKRKQKSGFSCSKCGREFVREANRNKHQEGCRK